MEYKDLIDKDMTLHTDNHKYRGILRKIHSKEGVLELEVGFDTLLINPENVYAVTLHKEAISGEDE